MTKHITIIGGGISGLATAFYLQKARQETGLPLRYTVLEAADRFGGKIMTAQRDGFTIDGGPDSFLTQKPWALQLCRELGMDEQLLPTNDHKRNIFVLKRGRLVPFPAGYRLAVPTEFLPFALSPLISPLGKLRMGLDLLIPPRRDESDESLASFIRRRLGQEALEMIAEPLMAGIYNADSQRLSMQSTFPMFSEMERKHGSLIKAMQVAKKKQGLGVRRQELGGNGGKKPSMFTSFRGGMSEMVNTLANQLSDDLRLNSPVQHLQPTETGYTLTLAEGESIETNGIVLTTPASVAASLLADMQPRLATMLGETRYASTATISLGFRRADIQHPLNGFGFVVPKREGRPMSACTWSSTKFDHRAPEGHVLIRVFVGGLGKEKLLDLSDEDLVTLARSELLTTLNITAEPMLSQIFRWRNGTPQYDVGHLDRVTEMERLADQQPGLYVTGCAFRGIGIPDCVRSAKATAARVIEAIS